MSWLSPKLGSLLRHSQAIRAPLRRNVLVTYHQFSHAKQAPVSSSQTLLWHRPLHSTTVALQKVEDEKKTEETIPDEHMSIFKRFKKAYKEHGKVLVGVHCVTSSVWISIFYYAAASGLDLTPLLHKIGSPEKIIEIANSSVGNLATAYLMYKLATPARYTVTLAGTYSTVKYLQNHGYMPHPKERDNIRDLIKDSRSQMKDRYDDFRDDMKDKMGDMKDDLKDKYQDKVKRKS